MGKTPLTGRTLPSRANSPTNSALSKLSGGRNPAPERMPMAMGTSKAAPSLRRSAGAKLTVIRRRGNLNPLFSSAPRMRTLPSLIPASGKPTILQPGKPCDTSTSTLMGAASIPMTVAESTRASTPLAQSENGATCVAQAFQLLALPWPGDRTCTRTDLGRPTVLPAGQCPTGRCSALLPILGNP